MTATVTLANLYNDLDRRLAALANDDSPVQKSRAIVEKALAGDSAIYGVNTGFGILASTRIDDAELGQLQKNLLLSHACGTGDPIPPDITRLMMQLKVHALALGNSGVSLPIFRQLLKFCQHDILPHIPSQGSVGASGDLAPLAHMSLPLVGHGLCWKDKRTGTEAATETLARHGLDMPELGAQDGIAQRHVHQLHPAPAQQPVAANSRQLLTDPELPESHKNCGKVQDPYSLRCIPQVHGASRDALDHANAVIERELNSVTDNPLVFDDGDIVSAGNFHGQPLALALDYAAIALSELASISERRSYLLLEGHDGLPKLLMRDTGTNSGFMIPQYTAAALVSENKVLAHPASVDTIPTSLGQEDHVSMGSISALKLLRVLHNAERVLAVEMLNAAQALDFRKPLKPGAGVLRAHDFVRSHIEHAEQDRELGIDINACTDLISSGHFTGAVEAGGHTLN